MPSNPSRPPCGRGTGRRPDSIRRVSAAPPSLPGVRHHYVDAGGLLTHVAEAGAGEPLVMLHGWPQHWYCWRGLMPALSQRWRVICPDLRGFGWTEAPPGGYEKEQLATDVLALLDAMGVESFHLVGHDWGGFVAFLMALREPERIRGLLALAIVHPWMQRELLAPQAWRFAAYQAVMSVPVLGPFATSVSPAYLQTVFRLGGAGLDPRAVESYVATLRQPARAAAASKLYRTFATRELGPILEGRYADVRSAPAHPPAPGRT